MAKISKEEYECLYCGRQVSNGEEVLLINGEEEFACMDCVEVKCFTTYEIGGEVVATENDCEFGKVIYGE